MSTPDITPYQPQAAPVAEIDADDWDDAPITPRARMPRLTKVLIVVAIGAATFAAGVFAQRHWGKSSSAGQGSAAAFSGTGFAARQGGGGSGAGTGRAGFGGSDTGGLGTVGQVAYIKGSTLYVADASGNIVKVQVPSGVRVTKSETATLNDVRPGDTVVVRGQQGSDGTVQAASIAVGTIAPGSFRGGLQGGGSQGGGGQSGGSQSGGGQGGGTGGSG